MSKVVVWLVSAAVAIGPATLVAGPAAPTFAPPHAVSPAAAPASAPDPRPDPRRVLRPDLSDTVRGRTTSVPVPGRSRVLVLPAYWGSQRPEPTRAEIKRVVLGDAAAWFARVSRGRHRLVGRVTPYLRISRAQCQDNYAMYDLVSALKRKARARGIGVRGYNRFMVVTPQCRTTSLGSLPGSETWIRDKDVTADVVIHELGHNLGLEHADGLICSRGNLRVTIASRKECHVDGYGDLYDVMGISSGVSFGQFSVPRLVQLGWAGRTQTLTGSGTVILAPAESSGTGIQGVRVKVSRKRSYWLEYRTDTSVARPYSEIVTAAGVQVRLQIGRKVVQVLDAFPGEPDAFLVSPDAELPRVELPVASSFTSPEGIRFTTVSVGDTAVVRVTRGAPRPGTPATPVPLVAYGGEYDMHVAWQRVLDDNGAIVRGYRVRDSAGDVHEVRTTGGLISVLDAHGDRTPGGLVAVQAFNEIGDSGWSSTFPVHADTPTARIVSPLPGTVVDGRFVHVVVEAIPNPFTGSPISSVEFQRDGSRSWYEPVDLAAPYEATLQLFHSGETVIDAHVCAEDGACVVLHTPITVTDPNPGLAVLSPADGQIVGSQFELRVRITNNLTPLETLRVRFGSSEKEFTGQFTGDVTLLIDAAALATEGTGTYSLSVDGFDSDNSNDTFYSDQVVVDYQP